MTAFIVIAWIVSLICVFVAGLLVYRNNAKKFKALEKAASAKGKQIEDLIK